MDHCRQMKNLVAPERPSLAEQKQMLRKASPEGAAPDLPTKCASRCILSFLLRNNLSFVRNSLHILALKTRQFGNILGLAFILINLQYNCQNLCRHGTCEG